MKKATKIINKKVLRTIIKNGKKIILSVATKTDAYERPSEIASAIETPFAYSVQQAKDSLIPVGTSELISRDSQHESEADPQSHFTVIARDEEGRDLALLHVKAQYPPPNK